MQCSKCGKNLDDSAVFCDKCGSFVMHFTCIELPNNGYRVRHKRYANTIFTIIICVVLAVCLGIGVGYLIIHHDILEREAAKYADNNFKISDEIWEKSLMSDILNYKDNSAANRNNSKRNQR